MLGNIHTLKQFAITNPGNVFVDDIDREFFLLDRENQDAIFEKFSIESDQEEHLCAMYVWLKPYTKNPFPTDFPEKDDRINLHQKNTQKKNALKIRVVEFLHEKTPKRSNSTALMLVEKLK